MPKVLRIINRFNLGGPTFNVGCLTKYLAPEFETLLVRVEKEEDEGSSTFILEQMGIKPIIIPELKRSISWKNDRIAYKKIKKIIEEFQPDIVHTHASKAGAIGRLAAHNMNVPVVVHTFHGHVFHSYFGKAKSALYTNIERWLAQKTDAIVAISPAQKKELVEIYEVAKEEKVTVIPLGFDLERFMKDTEEKRASFRRQYLIGDDELVITIIGRLAPVKNHIFFVDVLKALYEINHNKIRVFIVGDGETRTMIEEKLRSNSIDFTDFNTSPRSAAVTFTSWIKNVEYPLAGSEIVCLTSDNEGTPVSLIEAQAAGKPVVSTDVGGVIDVVTEGCGLISPVGDVLKMAENLNYFLNNPELRVEIATKGRDSVNEKFNYTRLIKDMSQLYRSLLKKAGE